MNQFLAIAFDLLCLAFGLICAAILLLVFFHGWRRVKDKRGRVLSDGLHQARRRESEFIAKQKMEFYWDDYIVEQSGDPWNKTQLTALVWFCKDNPDFRKRGYQLALQCAAKTRQDEDWIGTARLLGQLCCDHDALSVQKVFTDVQLFEDLAQIAKTQ